jgi:regulator of cell morphogenesis and NO signaling
MAPNIESTLAELAVTIPEASRVFHRSGLDYCCGGGRSLQEACRDRGLDAAAILDEISQSAASKKVAGWDTCPLDELVHFIVSRYHDDLRKELPELVELARKVEDRHAAKQSCPRGLADHLQSVHESVLDHLAKEEMVLFPLILSGQGIHAAGPIQAMEHEHRDHARNLERIRELTNSLTLPPEACASWQALYLRLNQLEADLMEHIHLENNVLFPRALRES